MTSAAKKTGRRPLREIERARDYLPAASELQSIARAYFAGEKK